MHFDEFLVGLGIVIEEILMTIWLIWNISDMLTYP